MTIIDLGECEDTLRKLYNLSNNETIYIKMLEIFQEGMRIPKVEYDIYSKLGGENLNKFDINSCQNNKIFLLIPVNNIDNLDKLNTESDYYNNFCYVATSDSGTDITLNDRKMNILLKQYVKMIVILLIIIIPQKKQNVHAILKNLLHLLLL